MQFDPKLTLDGLMTLIGGGLALLGVWLSNRQATASLRKQLDADKSVRVEEARRQKRTVATAILLAMDDFCMHFANFYVSCFGLNSSETPETTARLQFIPTVFIVFPNVADRLGDLGGGAASAVVRFHSRAEAFNHYIQLSQSASTRMQPVPLTSQQSDAGRSRTMQVLEGHRPLLGEIGFAFGEIERLLHDFDRLSQQALVALHDLASPALPGVARIHEVAARMNNAQTN
jgi:hypothetical protein